jgi:CheY-like chemotaxis protein
MAPRRSSAAAHRAARCRQRRARLLDDRERRLQAGMNDYLAKPFDRATLAEKLARWLPAQAA